MVKRRILVIGSKAHNRADCFDWLQPFPNIEEYDFIIINLQSLTQDVYDKIQVKIRRMQESITTVFNTDREIFCIMNKCIYPSPTPLHVLGIVTADYVPPTNYDWLPVRISVSDRKKGTSIDLHNHRFEWYFECVDKWDSTIEISTETSTNLLRMLFYKIMPIATNKSKKTIAGSLKRQTLFGKTSGKGVIHLLPPPTKSDTHRSIEIILDIILGRERKIIPPWRKDIEIPRVEEFQQKIQQKRQKQMQVFRVTQEEISELQKQKLQWDSYRDLLTSTGEYLENIVKKALFDIGIKTKKTDKGFPADLVSNKVAIEITGIKGCVGTDSEKISQTSRFKLKHKKKEKIILIANTHMDMPPQEREGRMDFSPQVEEYFEDLGVCCLTSKTLFELWKDVVTGKKDSKGVVKKILTKNGELMLSEFE